MLANRQTMIAAGATLRTPPAVYAGFRPDFSGVTPAQWVTWKLGNTNEVGDTFRAVGESLCKAVDLASGERVLNVTGGNGIAALNESENLPFRNAAFDVVLGAFSAMFAPDHFNMTRELLRVCRPGGRVGLACWTPEGFDGQVQEVIARYSMSEDGQSSLWGNKVYLNDLFGHSADALGATTHTHVWMFGSTNEWLDTWCAPGGALHHAYKAIDPDWRAQFTAELLSLADRFNEATDGSMIVNSEYLEFLVHKSTWRI